MNDIQCHFAMTFSRMSFRANDKMTFHDIRMSSTKAPRGAGFNLFDDK